MVTMIKRNCGKIPLFRPSAFSDDEVYLEKYATACKYR